MLPDAPARDEAGMEAPAKSEMAEIKEHDLL